MLACVILIEPQGTLTQIPGFRPGGEQAIPAASDRERPLHPKITMDNWQPIHDQGDGTPGTWPPGSDYRHACAWTWDGVEVRLAYIWSYLGGATHWRRFIADGRSTPNS